MTTRAGSPPLAAVTQSGVLYALLAYTAWGLTPLYWKTLAHVGALEITGHRVLWTVAVTTVILVVVRRLGELRDALSTPRSRRALIVTSAIIGGNWALYVYAVNTGQILATSLGYYLNPLLSVILGVGFLGERLRPLQAIAVALAAAGVALKTLAIGAFPWIAVALGASFAVYGLLKKTSGIGALPALAAEAALLAPIASVGLAIGAVSGDGAGSAMSGQTIALLAGGGIITAGPLLWFAGAARRLRLATVGLFQYLAPTIAFVLAVGFYGEPFRAVDAVVFGLIWSGVVLYAADGWRADRGQAAAARHGAGNGR